MASSNSTYMLTDRWLSRASSLPQGSAVWRLLGREYATTNLVTLDRFKQRLEVAFAETIVAFTLDEFEEHRPHQGFRENLQQQTLVARFGRTVQQNAPCLQLINRLAVVWQTAFEHFVIGF